MSKSKVYLDYNATTPIHPEIINLLPKWAEEFGNPSSIHWASREPKRLIRDSRQALAQMLNCDSLELVFTSGGTESNNSIIKGVMKEYGKQRPIFITTKAEHPCVREVSQELLDNGFQVEYIPVSRGGEFDFEYFKKVLTNKVALVSIMYANNETGTIFPIQKIAKLTHSVGALFHSDMVQAFGKIPIDLKTLDVDFASFSAHKFYGLKGVGATYCKKGLSLPTYVIGGGQERGRRSGTENILGILSFGHMAKKNNLISENYKKLETLRNEIENKILNEIPDTKVTGQLVNRLPNCTNIVISNVDGETLSMCLDMEGFALSTGSACSSGSPEPSKTLQSMGLSRDEAQSSLRISIGWATTQSELMEFLISLKDIVERIRNLRNRVKDQEIAY